MSPRKRAAKKPKPTSPRQAEVLTLVSEFRHASVLIRGLATNIQGHRLNAPVALRHGETMNRACARLKRLGHKDIAVDLGYWHKELEDAQRGTDEAAKQCRKRARALTVGIDLKTARII